MTALPIWPTAMRQSGGAGVTGAPQTNVASFTPDIGPSINRRRATSFTSIYDIDFAMLTREEYDAFKEFFHTTLMDGVLPFAWTHPLTDVLMRARFYLSDGAAYEETRVKSDRYSIRCRVQFINIIENEAVLALDYEAGIWLDFATGKYSIINTDFTIETGSIDSILNFSRASVATYIGSDGLVKSAASGVLRYTYDPSTLAALGFLSEESRTNAALWCRDCTNAAWTKTNITATKNQIGADGVSNSATSLAATATNGTCLQAITLASSARLQSAYIKRLVGTGNVQMTTDNGSTWTTIAITSAWARYTIPAQTLANPTIGFRLATSGDAIAVDFIQNENGSFPTSPIATTTVAVTRAADVAYILLSTLPYNAAEVTLLADYRALYADAVNNKIALSVNDNTFDNYMAIGHNVANFPIAVSVVATATQASLNTGAIVPSNRVRQVAAFKANDFSLYQNASAATPDTSGTVPTVTRLHIGSLAGGYGWVNGPIKQAAMYASRRANAANSALSVAA